MTAVTDTPESSSLSALGEALEAAAETIGTARTGVTETARTAAGKVGSAVGTAAYHTSYGVSYGLVFSAVLLKEFLPEKSSVRRGLEEGAEAAFVSVAARRVDVEVEEVEPEKPVRRSAKRAVRSDETGE